MSLFDDILKDFAEDVVSAAQRNIGATRTVNGKKRRIDSSGTLRNNLDYTIRGTKKKSILFGAKGKAGNYAQYVEYGRNRGSFPPIDAILKWMKVKPVRLREGGSFVKQTDTKLRGLAFLIARKIAHEGIEPTFFYTEALVTTFKKYEKKFGEAITKEIDANLNL
jgi:hypothetical protein